MTTATSTSSAILVGAKAIAKAIAAAALALALAVPAAPAGAEAWELPGIYHTVHLAAGEFRVPPDLMECIRTKEGGANRHVWGDGGRALGLWQFHVATFRTAALAAGYPAWIADDPSWRADVTVSTRAAAALMARPDLGGPWHWTPYLDGRCR